MFPLSEKSLKTKVNKILGGLPKKIRTWEWVTTPSGKTYLTVFGVKPWSVSVPMKFVPEFIVEVM